MPTASDLVDPVRERRHLVGRAAAARACRVPREAARVGRDLVLLTKPRITALVVVTAWVGARLSPARQPATALLWSLLGTAMAAAAASVLNCWLERERDGRMARTRDRPLPAGRLAPASALALGLSLGVGALLVLAARAGAWATALGAVAMVGYVTLYTPLKARTPWALLVGAVCGALPPAMGWTAATGRLDPGAVVLFAILLLWQLPHFLAIAVLRWRDYDRAGLPVVSVAHGPRAAARAALAGTLALVAATVAPLPFGMAGAAYLWAALVLGAGLVVLAARVAAGGDAPRPARALMLGSLAYLPLLLVALVADAG